MPCGAAFSGLSHSLVYQFIKKRGEKLRLALSRYEKAAAERKLQRTDILVSDEADSVRLQFGDILRIGEYSAKDSRCCPYWRKIKPAPIIRG